VTAARILLALLLMVSATACGGSPREETGAPTTAGAPATTQTPVARWAITAIDYHFHDAHPTPPLTLEATLVFKNEGRNLHNVTIQGTSFSQDIRPGQGLRIAPLGSLLDEPGRYRLVCKYHADRGMTGVIVVVGDSG
jgi:hypothetical protein